MEIILRQCQFLNHKFKVHFKGLYLSITQMSIFVTAFVNILKYANVYCRMQGNICTNLLSIIIK